MKNIIRALTALLIISSLFGTFQAFPAPLKKVEITLQSAAEGPPREALKRAGEIITARMEAYGITDFQVVPVYEKGQLKVAFEAAVDLDEIFGLLTAKGAVRFCKTYSRSEVSEMLAGWKNAQKLQSFLKLASGEDEENASSAILGSFQPGEIETITRLLNEQNLVGQLPANLQFAWSRSSEQDGSYDLYALQFDEKLEPIVDGHHIQEVHSVKEEQSGNFTIKIHFDQEGTRLWADGTRRNVGRHVAIVVDELVYMAPKVMTPILHGEAQITGDFTADETKLLISLIKGGELPLELEIVGIN
jgi:SecD/SecF fusion protein